MTTAFNRFAKPDSPAEELDTQLSEERIRLTRDGFANISAYVITSVAGMVLVPILLNGLSREMYGLWIASMAIQYSSAFLSAGLGRCIAREVAAGGLQTTSRFVVAVSNAYILIGVTGGLAIAGTGTLLALWLHVSTHNLPVARLIFCLAGAGFCADQIQSLGMEILTGLRRFLTINLITSVSVAARTSGIILLFKVGGGLTAIASLHVFICAATGVIAYATALRLAPQFRLRLVRVQWREIRDQIGFSVASQIAAGFTTILWRSAPFLIGVLKGAAAIVPYELGQKLPMSVSSVSWQAADVLFPAASEYHSAKQDAHTRQLLELGTRGVLFFTLPFCIVLWILAPHLLATWVGGKFPEAVWILRIVTLAILADSAAATSIQILWGQGQVRWASILTMISASAGLAMACVLIVRIGVAGAAIGLATGVFIGSAGFIHAAARVTGCHPLRVLWAAMKDLSFPALLASGFLLLIAPYGRRESWSYLILIAAVCFILYATTFYFLGAQSIEKSIAKGVILKASKGLYSFYRESRRILERVPPLRWAILYTVEIKNTLRDSSRRDRASVERLYRESEDPFGFNRDLEQFRFQRALELLALVSNGTKFKRALEIGCAEGMFTRKLADQCDALEAVDLSPIALERAKRHCSDLHNIEFAEWDVRQDPVNGTFDLIVATGVLEYVLRPGTLSDIREKLTAGLRPGGYLLLGNTSQVRKWSGPGLGKR